MGAYTVCAASQFNGFEVSRVIYTVGGGASASSSATAPASTSSSTSASANEAMSVFEQVKSVLVEFEERVRGMDMDI